MLLRSFLQAGTIRQVCLYILCSIFFDTPAPVHPGQDYPAALEIFFPDNTSTHPFLIFQRLPVGLKPSVYPDPVYAHEADDLAAIFPNYPEDCPQTRHKGRQNNPLWAQTPAFLTAARTG